MQFFPSDHENISIAPLMPPDVISRIRVLTEKDKFSGTFLVNMFTMQYILHFPLKFKLLIDPVITGYFSNDKKNIVLDYNLSKAGRIRMTALTLILPFIILLAYIHLTSAAFSTISIYAVFYALCALFIYFLNVLIFKLKTKHIHRKIFIQVLY
ncbi:MAG: hypothetical protein K6G00_13105 [Treponema sp.]|nr:hypothetical protein [Treponema sp.]